MTLGNLDANGVGRYQETTPIPAKFSDYLNLALESVSGVLGRRITAASDAARDAVFPPPTTLAEQQALEARGPLVVRTDKGWTERYFSLADTYNGPHGARPAGWYPVDGMMPVGAMSGQGDQAIAAGTLTSVDFTTIAQQTDGIACNLASNLISITQPGLYAVSGRVMFAAATSGNRELQLFKSGQTYLHDYIVTATPAVLKIDALVKLVAGDTLELKALSGAAVSLFGTAGKYERQFSARYLAPERSFQ